MFSLQHFKLNQVNQMQFLFSKINVANEFTSWRFYLQSPFVRPIFPLTLIVLDSWPQICTFCSFNEVNNKMLSSILQWPIQTYGNLIHFSLTFSNLLHCRQQGQYSKWAVSPKCKITLSGSLSVICDCAMLSCQLLHSYLMVIPISMMGRSPLSHPYRPSLYYLLV